jgi:hypothetical protein
MRELFLWYPRRLGAMSAREVVWRAASPLRMIAGRHDRFPPPDWAHPGLASLLRELASTYRESLLGDAERISAGELSFWGHPVEVDPAAPAWDTNPLGSAVTTARRERWQADPKPVWELHRQQHLFPLAAAASLGDRGDWGSLVGDQLLSWIDSCPPGTRPGWTSGYETAHRLVGWALSVPLVAPYLEAARLRRISESYALQASFAAARPSRFSSANNHRLAELTGVLAACLVTGAGDRWDELWEELEQEAVLQTFSDGGSREQASGYFLYVLEILWVAGLLARARGHSLGRLGERLASMLDWLEAVADSRGEPPPVGDDAEDRFLRPDYFAPREAQAIASRVRSLLAGEPSLAVEATRYSPNSRVLGESGYTVLRSRAAFGPVRIVLDVGDLGFGSLAGHGHADALSVLVDLNGSPLLRDSGTATYVPAAGRDDFRVSSAHNTICVDGESQAEPLGPHLWGRRYRTTLEASRLEAEFDYVRASHDGYLRRRAGAVHTRSVIYLKPDLLIVLDRVRARRACRAALAWHLPPGEASEPLAVASLPESERATETARFSPRYSWCTETPRLVWTASGENIVFATAIALGGVAPPAVALRHEDGSTVVELAEPRPVRVIESWSGAGPELAG